jgi:hypothetical protein
MVTLPTEAGSRPFLGIDSMFELFGVAEQTSDLVEHSR